MNQELLSWLLDSDVSIQYQAHRDLLGEERPDLRARIADEGWGAAFLLCRNANGHWGLKFYQPKWTSTNYTLLDLKELCIAPDVPEVKQTVEMVLSNEKSPDGGILPIGITKLSDVCINGMVLNYASYFGAPQSDLESIVDCILSLHMPDGGFNCMVNRKGAVHSSLHSTISVAEGILEYANSGYTYRLDDLLKAKAGCVEFMLQHRLFKSDKTGEIIDKRMLYLSYPGRWRYDILRALDFLRYNGSDYDPRMDDAIAVLLKKRKSDGTWPLQAKHPGQTHFDMEQAGKPSRWNTLRASRVLQHYQISD